MPSAPAPADVVAPVTVRFWAAARAATGLEREAIAVPLEGIDLGDLMSELTARHTELVRVLAVASLLVDGHPHGRAAPAQGKALPGALVEILPPFAGG